MISFSMGRNGPVLATLLLGLAVPLGAQDPTPSPSPVPREQDELDFPRSSLLVGSGARAMGMGGAFLARADDATAASWNPAGLSYLRRPEISIVGLHSSVDEKTRSTDGTVFRTDHITADAPDFLSAAYPVSLGSVSGAVQLSFQRAISFTGKRRIDEAGKPQEALQPSKTVVGEDGFDVLALGTGLKLTRGLRIGATVNHWFHGFRQTRERLGRRPTVQEVDFGLSGFSINAGIIWTPWEALNLGVAGKTPMHGQVRLTRTRTDFYEEPAAVTTNDYGSRDVRLDLPGALGIGVSWRPSSPLTLSADFTRTFWSNGQIRNYFTLAPQLPGSLPPPPDVFPSLLYPRIFDTEQEDTTELRMGAEYAFIWRDLRFPLRAGYFTETQYFKAAGGAPRFSGFAVGAGIGGGPFLLDIAYLYESGRYAAIGEDPGSAEVKIRRVLFSLIYRHGAGQ